MKKIIARILAKRSQLPTLFFLFLILGSCSTSPDQSADSILGHDQITYPFRYEDGISIRQISAHRGGGDIPGYPENALESMQYILKKTSAWMEIDIRETADGQLILMHDASLDRTTTGSGRVEDLNWSGMKSLWLEDNQGQKTDFHIPLLKDVLEWNEESGHTVLNLDIKQGVRYEDVLNLVRQTNQIDNVVAIVYNLNQAKALRRLDKEIVISLPVRNMDEWHRLKNSDLGLKNLIAFTGTIRSDKNLYDTLHANGFLTIFGTMGNIDRQAASKGKIIYEKLYEDGADILSTDRPLEFK